MIGISVLGVIPDGGTDPGSSIAKPRMTGSERWMPVCMATGMTRQIKGCCS